MASEAAVSACCIAHGDEQRYVSSSESTVCPGCTKTGKPVATRTVKNLVRDHTRVSTSDGYCFCRTLECSVVYFSEQQVFQKADMKVRVGIKEHDDPIPLCYCFDYTWDDLSRDLALDGDTDVPKRVKAEVKRGFCACDVKNPSGKCCLGDITRAVQQIKAARQRTGSTGA